MTNLDKLEKDIREKVTRLNGSNHPIMLNDVLEWLDKLPIAFFKITSKGSIIKYNDYDGNDTIGRWDLQSIYLYDQPQKLIDYLAGLI